MVSIVFDLGKLANNCPAFRDTVGRIISSDWLYIKIEDIPAIYNYCRKKLYLQTDEYIEMLGIRSSGISDEDKEFLDRAFWLYLSIYREKGNEHLLNPTCKSCKNEECRFNGLDITPEDLATATKETSTGSEFPVDVFPKQVGNYLKELSQGMNAPLNYLATAFIVATASLIGDKAIIEVTDTYRVFPNLWACLIGSVSSKKSPCMAQIVDNITTLEIANNDENPRQVITNIATLEAIYDIMAQPQNGSCLVFADELKGFISDFNRYTNGRNGDRQNYLSMWNCNSIRIDRKNKDKAVFVKHACLSILGSTQFCNVDLFKADDGWSERWLFDVVEDGGKYFGTNNETAVSKENKTAVLNTFKTLYSNESNIKYKLSDSAYTAFKGFENDIKRRMNEPNFNISYEALYAKSLTFLAKFTLILHILENINNLMSNKIGANTVNKAISLTWYYLNQSMRVIYGEKSLNIKLKDHLYEKLIRKDSKCYRLSDILALRIKGLSTKDESIPLLESLEAEHKVISYWKERDKGKPVKYYIPLKE